MQVGDQIKEIQHTLKPYGCKLVAVSKTKPFAHVQSAYDVGQRDFGENKVQELVQKYENLPRDIRWHMIGHLQRNKVKYIAPFVHLIHAVDSRRLLNEINKQAEKNNRVIQCLLQVHIASEQTKFGFSPEELQELLQDTSLQDLSNVKIIGLMGMATFTSDQQQIIDEFTRIHNLFQQYQTTSLSNVEFSELSIGMTNDYHIALEHGSTMVRIGSAIFGERNT